MASVSLLKSSLVVDKYEWAKSQPLLLPSATAFRCNSFADEVVKNMLEGGDGEPNALEVSKCWWTPICHQGRKVKGENDVYDGQQGQQDDNYIAGGDCTTY